MKTKRRRISESKRLTWADFSTPETDAMEKKYLPRTGEGENMATQTVTAVCKLIYKWFNDGDVFDNTYALEGWANDLSSYANWLDSHVPEAADVLARIENVTGESDYTRLLYDLMNTTLNQGLLSTLETIPATDSVYDCDGPYEFKEPVTCPECGAECDEYDLDHYGMCSDCYNEQQYEEEDDEEDFYESRKSNRRVIKESDYDPDYPDPDEYETEEERNWRRGIADEQIRLLKKNQALARRDLTESVKRRRLYRR